MGSPPPGQAYGPPPGAQSPPPQVQQIHQAPPAVHSPGQEKQEYYVGQHPVQPGMVHQQSGGVMPVMSPAQQGSQYQTAVPLASLQKSPAPVDCPNCRQRVMTRTEFHSGNYTQYVLTTLPRN